MDKRSPFKSLSLGAIVGKINSYVDDGDVNMTDGHAQTPGEYYNFDISRFKSLFGWQLYGDSVIVCSSVEDATRAELELAKVMIVVGDVPPQSETQSAHQFQFDLQVVCVLRSREKSRDPSKYDAICYMRHVSHKTSGRKREETQSPPSASLVSGVSWRT